MSCSSGTCATQTELTGCKAQGCDHSKSLPQGMEPQPTWQSSCASSGKLRHQQGKMHTSLGTPDRCRLRACWQGPQLPELCCLAKTQHPRDTARSVTLLTGCSAQGLSPPPGEVLLFQPKGEVKFHAMQIRIVSRTALQTGGQQYCMLSLLLEPRDNNNPSNPCILHYLAATKPHCPSALAAPSLLVFHIPSGGFSGSC